MLSSYVGDILRFMIPTLWGYPHRYRSWNLPDLTRLCFLGSTSGHKGMNYVGNPEFHSKDNRFLYIYRYISVDSPTQTNPICWNWRIIFGRMHLVFGTTSVICFWHLNSRKVAGVAKPGCESALHSTWALALAHMLHVYICQMFFFAPMTQIVG